MKKNLLLLLAILPFFFATSCLDDNDASISGFNQFAVVQTNSTGGKFAYIQNAGMFYNSQMDQYTVGDAFLISSYRANSSDMNSSGVFTASEFIIGDNYPNKIQRSVLIQEADTATNIKNQIGLKALNIISANPVEAMYLDRLLMSYTADIADGVNYDLNFYYDRNKQVGQAGTPLTNERRVLDIVIAPTGEGIGEKKSTTKQFVLNASNLREIIKPESISSVSQSIIIDLRLSMYDSTSNEYKQAYLSNAFSFTYYASDVN